MFATQKFQQCNCDSRNNDETGVNDSDMAA